MLDERHRRAETRHPHIGAVGEPVVVADESEAAASPRPSPRVLNPEPALVVGDDGERVAAGHLRLRPVRDDAVGADVLPAVVHRCRCVEDANLGNRRMHRDLEQDVAKLVSTEMTLRDVVVEHAAVDPGDDRLRQLGEPREHQPQPLGLGDVVVERRGACGADSESPFRGRSPCTRLRVPGRESGHEPLRTARAAARSALRSASARTSDP